MYLLYNLQEYHNKSKKRLSHKLLYEVLLVQLCSFSPYIASKNGNPQITQKRQSSKPFAL